MAVEPNAGLVAPDVIDAAREFICSEGCLVPVSLLLEELGDKFGDRFRVSPDTYEVLDLIETLLGTCVDRPQVLRRVPHRRCEHCGHMPDTVIVRKADHRLRKPSPRLPGDHDQRRGRPT
jgi:hypothetical protein